MTRPPNTVPLPLNAAESAGAWTLSSLGSTQPAPLDAGPAPGKVSDGAVFDVCRGALALRALLAVNGAVLLSVLAGALGPALQRLRSQAASLDQIARWPGMDAERAVRLLNGAYLRGGLMVLRHHPAARDATRWRGNSRKQCGWWRAPAAGATIPTIRRRRASASAAWATASEIPRMALAPRLDFVDVPSSAII